MGTARHGSCSAKGTKEMSMINHYSDDPPIHWVILLNHRKTMGKPKENGHLTKKHGDIMVSFWVNYSDLNQRPKPIDDGLDIGESSPNGLNSG